MTTWQRFFAPDENILPPMHFIENQAEFFTGNAILSRMPCSKTFICFFYQVYLIL
jgi:hypothetical protein